MNDAVDLASRVSTLEFQLLELSMRIAKLQAEAPPTPTPADIPPEPPAVSLADFAVDEELISQAEIFAIPGPDQPASTDRLEADERTGQPEPDRVRPTRLRRMGIVAAQGRFDAAVSACKALALPSHH